ncbi:unnamed protein product [Polarella glacialis]|uniref:Ion transport domain-containing protein n=1 Tax=Polarella glacialis TaxID=89957 RepID=A0A813JBC1_POLGL|nr:unnamed protein product [Polarella glacialis]
MAWCSGQSIPLKTSVAELGEALANLGPEIQSFKQAYDSLVDRVATLELQAFLPEINIGVPVLEPGAPDVLLRLSEQGCEEETRAVLKRDRSSRILARRVTGTEVNVDNALDIPKPLQGHWKDTPASSEILQKGTSQAHEQGARRAPVRASGGQPELDSRWQDLYASNAEEAEEQEEVALRSLLCNSESEGAGTSSKRATCKDVHCIGPVLSPVSLQICIWGSIGLAFVSYDAIMLPLNSAWDREWVEGSPDYSYEYYVFLAAIVYWTTDILVTFNTAFYDSGALVKSRKLICWRYFQSWLFFDTIIVCLDLAFLVFSGQQLVDQLHVARSARFTRLLRMARLVRLLRAMKILKNLGSGQFAQRVEEIGEHYGVRWVIIAAAVLKAMTVFFLMAHCLACLWYFLGSTSKDAGEIGWLDLDDLWHSHMDVQYLRSLHYALALMTTNTNDITIAPQNQIERAFTICTIFFSLLVVGYGATQIATAITNLTRSEVEVNDIKRQLNVHLRSSDVSDDLTARIMRFAVHSLKRRRNMLLDPFVRGLLSTSLESELTVSQRVGYLRIHPLLDLITSSHPEALLGVCSSFQVQLFAEREVIFTPRTWCECMYITWHGKYSLLQSRQFSERLSRQSGGDSQTASEGSHLEETIFDQPRCFSEVSLFARVMHHSTLSAMVFGDAFTLTGQDFAHAVRHHPACVATIYRYANAYLNCVWEGAPNGETLVGKVMVNDLMPKQLAEESCLVARREQRTMSLAHVKTYLTCNTGDITIHELVKSMMEGKMSDEEASKKLPVVFQELSEVDGPYAMFDALVEQKRAISAMLSVYFLLADRYESFIKMQPRKSRMSKLLWEELQGVLQWAQMTEDMVQATFVLLAIRGLGKVKPLVRSLPRDQRGSAEHNVLGMMKEAPQLFPSVALLSPEMQELLEKALFTHTSFNLAQLLQGENNPSHLAVLQNFVKYEGEQLLKFYLINLIGIMSGIKGGETLQGSLFMDQENGTTVLLGIQCLQRLASSSPRAIYWTYIYQRSLKLTLPDDTPEHLAIARLACLIRSTAADKTMLQEAWSKLMLSRSEQSILVEHLLADGIQDKAFLFAFLPLYFDNAKNNQVIGLHRALTVLVDLIEMIQADISQADIQEMNINVDLTEIAAFAREVKAPRIFEAVSSFTKTIHTATCIQVSVSTRHWQRVGQKSWLDEPVQEINQVLKKLERKTESFEAMLRETLARTPSEDLIRCYPDAGLHQRL